MVLFQKLNLLHGRAVRVEAGMEINKLGIQIYLGFSLKDLYTK
jgi:hypothetical protein